MVEEELPVLLDLDGLRGLPSVEFGRERVDEGEGLERVGRVDRDDKLVARALTGPCLVEGDNGGGVGGQQVFEVGLELQAGGEK